MGSQHRMSSTGPWLAVVALLELCGSDQLRVPAPQGSAALGLMAGMLFGGSNS